MRSEAVTAPLRSLAFRLRALWRADAIRDEIDEEFRFHIEMRTEANIERGMAPDEARREAERRFGGMERMKEKGYDVRGGRWLEETVQDLRYGTRTLLKHRAFAAVAILTLGLGIGANTAVFSVINAVFLKPLQFQDPERLVVVWEDATADGYPRDTPAPGNYLDWRASNSSFEDMAATADKDYNLTGDGEPLRVPALAVTANLLPVLGVAPALGRNFVPEEDVAGGPKAVILGNGLWKERYGAAPDVVGREIMLNDEKYTVAGVMPQGFQLLDKNAQILVPLALKPDAIEQRGNHYLRVVARLKPGVTVEQAQANMASIMERIGREFPDQATGLGAAVVPLREQIAGDARTPLLVLVTSVGLVLLIACINVGNLMLSRAAGRSREIAVRAALGASRARLLRQLLTENVPLVAAGAVVGLLFATWSFSALRQLIPPSMRQSTALGLDLRVLGFTLLVALAASALFGLVPALEASKTNLNEALRKGSARTGFSSGGRLQSALVAGEVCLAIALLVGAGLLIQTFFALRGQYAQLDTDRVVTAKTILSSAAYKPHERKDAFYTGVLERVAATPGVVAAGFTNGLPLETKGDANSFTVDGHPVDPNERRSSNTRLVTPDYLKALGIAMRSGRPFGATDSPQSQPVAIVNETLARLGWQGEDPIGKQIKLGGPDSDAPWMTVVGIAADVRQTGVDKPVKPEMYVPYAQCDFMEFFAPKTLVVRTAGDQAAVVSAIRSAVAAVDPNQPVSDVKTMSDVFGEETSSRRLAMLLLGAFAAVALLLASVGIYGVLSQLVAQRTNEIGVRLALGATPSDVVKMVVGRGMRLVVIGSVAGLVLSLILSRLMASLLFGVSAADPLTLAGVPVLLALVAFVACYVPARRASRVDPTVALRYE